MSTIGIDLATPLGLRGFDGIPTVIESTHIGWLRGLAQLIHPWCESTVSNTRGALKACKCVLPRAQEVADGNHARLEPAGDKSEAYLDALESMVDPVLVRKLQHLDAMATEFYEGIDALRRAYCALHRGVDPHDVTLAQLHASCHEFSGSSARLRSELAALLAHADAMVPSIETASPEFYRVCIDKDADFVPRSWMDQKFPTVHRLLIEALDMCRPASAVLPDSCDPNSP